MGVEDATADERAVAQPTTAPMVLLHQEADGDTLHTALQVQDQWIAIPWPYESRRLRTNDCFDDCVHSCKYEVRGSTMLVGCEWAKKADDQSYIAVDWPQLAQPRVLDAPVRGSLSADGRYLISTGREGYVMSAADGTIELDARSESYPYMSLRCGDEWYYKRDHEDPWHGLRSQATFTGSLECSPDKRFLITDSGVLDAYTLREVPARSP